MPRGLGDDDFSLSRFKRAQLPVRTCFGISAKKSQEQFVSGRLEVDLRDICYSHGHLYIALSPTTHLSSRLTCSALIDSAECSVKYPEIIS